MKNIIEVIVAVALAASLLLSIILGYTDLAVGMAIGLGTFGIFSILSHDTND